jgi:hypothetical protein
MAVLAAKTQLPRPASPARLGRATSARARPTFEVRGTAPSKQLAGSASAQIQIWRKELRENGGDAGRFPALYHQAPGYRGLWNSRLHATDAAHREQLLTKWMRSGLWAGLFTLGDSAGYYSGSKPFRFTLRPDQLLFDPGNPKHAQVYRAWLKEQSAATLAQDPWQVQGSGFAKAENPSGASFASRLRRFNAPPWEQLVVPAYSRFYEDLGIAGMFAPQGWIECPQIVLLNPRAIQDVK